ncbi:SDR family NAD(P)-dependent oxidoreductase [Streptomyces sp. MJM1172]|uniref:SDR family NAD(P)-dependent oxidoreductase n=1 Tax=Streptomyces sp. MJM1172 TaxID=1703926 RepID=UPI00093B8B00|nr:SDR family NAD(P)-dependent oxidoreductase [Streptomyces sp. MJM1172]
MSRAVAVVGMGIAVPGAHSPEEFWKVLLQERHMFGGPGHMSLDNWYSPDPEAEDKSHVKSGGYPRTIPVHPDDDADHLDRTGLLLRHCVRQALAEPARRRSDRMGAYVALPPGSLALEESTLRATAADALEGARRGEGSKSELLRERLAAHYPHAAEHPRRTFADQVIRGACAGLLPGGSEMQAVDSACSSSLYAIDLAVKALLAGERDLVVCGGANTGSRRDLVLFSKARGFSHSGQLRAFDADADGTLFSDSAAVIALKRLDRALDDGDEVLGLLGGFGASVDGTGSLVAPDPEGQKLSVRRARRVGDLKPSDVDWIVGHGSGTPVGDTAELEGLAELAEDSFQLITSNKPLVGHGAWAAGAVSVIHVMLALRHGVIPGERFFSRLPDGIREGKLIVPHVDTPWRSRADRVRTAGICAYGLGGGNAHLLVHGAEAARGPMPRAGGGTREDRTRTAGDPVVLVGWSAHLPGEPSAQDVTDWLRGNGPAPAATFGEEYPLPPFRQLRMPPVTARSIDRTHLMAISAAARFVEEHGELWDFCRATTGVFTGHTGPTRAMTEYTVRVAADDLLAVAEAACGRQGGESMHAYLDRVRERLPAANDASMPGQLANMISCQVANRHRLHGMALALDAGRSSTQAALHTAGRYLASGELDMALVVGASGHSGLLAEALTETSASLAEGAVVMALTRKSLADRQGWPCLARITTTACPADDADRDFRGTGADAEAAEIGPPECSRDYQGADGALSVLRAVYCGLSSAVVRNADQGPRVVVHPLATDSGVSGADTPAAERRGTPSETTSEGTPAPEQGRPATPPPTFVDRAVIAYRRRDAVAVESRADDGALGPALRPGSLILVHSAALARDLTPLARKRGARIVSSDPRTEPDEVVALAGPDEEAASSTWAVRVAAGGPHLLVVASAREPESVWPAPPPSSLLRLQECLLAAVREMRPGTSGSVEALLLDPLRGHTTHPHLTLVTGFLRSLALELPCPVHAVVTDAALEAGLEQLAAERAARREGTVVQYRQGVRHVEVVLPAPLPAARAAAPLPLDRDSVVVATGGARGATAVAVTALARQVRPRVWLLGTTPADGVPPELLDVPEDELTRARRTYLRRELAARPGTPIGDLNRQFDALLRAREIQSTLRELRGLCGPDRVHYLACDLRDREQVMDTARQIHAHEGGVDLLIHGAGLIRSSAVTEKSLDDFRAVRDTKVAGYHHLKEAFASPAPRLWCTFSSASALTGGAGDTDYSAANEYLLAAARAEHGRRADEFAVAWGLWRDTGMVRDLAGGIARQLGIDGMSNTEGAAAFLAEISSPRPLEAAPVLGPRRGRAKGGGADAGPTPVPPSGLLGAPDSSGPAGADWSWRPDPDRDTYLAEHLVEGRPLLPAVMMLALAAEAARQLSRGAEVTGFRDLTVHEPLYTSPRGASVTCRITAERTGPNRIRVGLHSDLTTQHGRILLRDRPHCRVDVVLGTRPHPPAAPPPAVLPPLEDCPTARPDSSVQLSGVWRTNLHPAANTEAAEALWHPRLESDGVFAHLAIPALLIDSTARLFRYPPQPSGEHVMGVPVSITGIDLFTGATDTELAAAHPEGLRLHYRTADDRAVAVTRDGTVQLAVTGLKLHVTDRFPATIQYPEWRP